MTGLLFSLARPFLRALDAETAHDLTIRALKKGLIRPCATKPDKRLAVSAFGLEFPNPLGLAAGFDKNAEVADAMLGLGFGFVEVGSVTPRPQSGNPRPRLFRLTEDRAVINRMGFNNEGHLAVLSRLKPRKGVIGVNIGANKDSGDRIADYVAGLSAFSEAASYIVVNISSPNTPGLRSLQARDELERLLDSLMTVRKQHDPPLLLKIAPDLGEEELADIARLSAGRIDGLIVSNTTISRPLLKSRWASEPGGLSGSPLFDLATRQLARVYLLTRGAIPLIGVGGIDSAERAWDKIGAGASLVQLYSALVFQGPALVTDILHGLSQRLNAHGYSNITQAVGRSANELVHHGLKGT